MSVAPESVRVFVGLGSNLDEPHRQLENAFAALGSIARTQRRQVSSLYRSPPMGHLDQPDYLNAVAELETALMPEALLDVLQDIERAQGRVRAERWGPRTLDIDLLLYGDEEIFTERLTVPHPGLPQRAFVLYPLAELAPALYVPGHGELADLLRRVDATALQRLD